MTQKKKIRNLLHKHLVWATRRRVPDIRRNQNGISFSSGGLALVLVLLPLVLVWWVYETRLRAIHTASGVTVTSSRWTLLINLVLLSATVMFLAVAVARPARESRQSLSARSDAAVVYAFDVSESMSARASHGTAAQNRLSRATRTANIVASDLAEISSGVVGFTNIIVPHLMVTADHTAIAEAIGSTVQINSVPTQKGQAGQVTTDFDMFALSGVLFREQDAHKVLVIFTDGEVRDPRGETTLADAFKSLGITVVVVGMGKSDERLPVRDQLGNETGEDAAHAPTYGGDFLEQLAQDSNGAYLHEPSSEALADTIRSAVGESGETEATQERRSVESFDWLAILAAAISGIPFILRRRPFFVSIVLKK